MCQRFYQQGFSFLELLLAVSLLSVTLVGIAYYQMQTLSNTEVNYQQSMAVRLADNLALQLGSFDSPWLRQELTSRWQHQVLGYLPNSAGTLLCAQHHCEINIKWRSRYQKQRQASLHVVL